MQKPVLQKAVLCEYCYFREDCGSCLKTVRNLCATFWERMQTFLLIIIHRFAPGVASSLDNEECPEAIQ
jgi:hypothetical protein